MLLAWKYDVTSRNRTTENWIIYKNPDVTGLEDFIKVDHIEVHTDIWTNEKDLGLGFAIMAEGKVTMVSYPNNPNKFFALIETDYE